MKKLRSWCSICREDDKMEMLQFTWQYDGMQMSTWWVLEVDKGWPFVCIPDCWLLMGQPQLLNPLLSCSQEPLWWYACSDSASKLLVASCSSKIIGSFTIYCPCNGYLLTSVPHKACTPCSPTVVLNPSGRAVMNLWAFATLVVASISVSGMKISLSLPYANVFSDDSAEKD